MPGKTYALSSTPLNYGRSAAVSTIPPGIKCSHDRCAQSGRGKVASLLQKKGKRDYPHAPFRDTLPLWGAGWVRVRTPLSFVLPLLLYSPLALKLVAKTFPKYLIHLRLELVPTLLHFVGLLLLPAVLLFEHLLQPLRL